MARVYVSIPITGKDYNEQRKRASEVAAALVREGHSVVTPFDVVKDASTPYNECMGKCVEELLGCQAILMCQGWQSSRGCMAEMQVALVYGLAVMADGDPEDGPALL